jgi:hypothetical protein
LSIKNETSAANVVAEMKGHATKVIEPEKGVAFSA